MEDVCKGIKVQHKWSPSHTHKAVEMHWANVLSEVVTETYLMEKLIMLVYFFR